ncbi:MAG: ABC transporter ATP-binding protein/permease [Lachnospiraceae bacterium]|nr:ABC transporter ATP-binding protein/permease [Lachnospiraceae bacterium]
MKFIWKYLSEYKKEAILAPMFKMLEAFFELLVPLFVARIIDIGIPGKDLSYVLHTTIYLVIFAAAGYGVALLAQYFSAKAAIFSAASLRKDLFFHIQKFSDAKLDLVGSSSLLTRLTSDVNQVQNGVNMFLRLFLRSPFIVFGAAVCAFTVDVKGALVFAVALPLLILVVWLVMKSTLPRYKSIGKRLERLTLSVNENLTGVRVIRAFGNEHIQRRNFRKATDQLCNEQLCAGGIQSVLGPITLGVVNLSAVVILWIGGIRVNIGELSTGEVVALLNYMSQILVELLKLANLIILLTKALASSERIEKIMNIDPDERTKGEITDIKEILDKKEVPAVAAENLRFTYPDGNEETLSDISFTLEQGGVLGIIGGTGSGKSTIAKLIGHSYDITGGSVKLFGKEVSDFSDHAIAGSVALVPQHAQLFKGTIADNLRMSNEDATDDELWEALEAAQAADFVRQKPDGLNSKVERGGSNFSGGQRQRLTIARALVKKAPVVILDDSASALDMATEKALREALKNLSWKPALIIISQRASSVMAADNILVLEGGETVGYGPGDELLHSCPVYSEIYHTQFEEVAS